MYDDSSLRIDLNGVGVAPQAFDFVLTDDFFASQAMSDKLQGGRVEVSGSIVRVGYAFHIQWKAVGVLKVPCDFCLDDVECPIDVATRYQVEFAEEANETEDVITLIEGEHRFDLGWYVCESLVLSLPITNKHDDGACNAEMAATLSEYLAKDNSLAEEEEWN